MVPHRLNPLSLFFDLGGVVCNQYACQIDEFLDGVPKIYMLSISCISFISSPSSPRIVMTSRLTKRDDMFLGKLFMCSALVKDSFTILCVEYGFQDRGHEID